MPCYMIRVIYILLEEKKKKKLLMDNLLSTSGHFD